MDALLGAAALGDIGMMFPDNDPKYKGADSLKLLGLVFDRMSEKGYRIVNLDCTIIAQAPKLAGYIGAMRERISMVLNIGIDCVNVKATTEEHLGFTGAGEGIAAHAVVLIDN